MEESSARRSDRELMRNQRGGFHACQRAKTSPTLKSRDQRFVAIKAEKAPQNDPS